MSKLMIEGLNERVGRMREDIRKATDQAIWIADLTVAAEAVLKNPADAQAKVELMRAASHIGDAEWQAKKPSDAICAAAWIIHDIANLWRETRGRAEDAQRAQMREALTYLQGVAEGKRVARQ